MCRGLQVLLLPHVTKDHDINQVNHTICEVQLPQGVLHEMLECRGCVVQPKGHADKLIEPKVTHRDGRVLLTEARLEIH